MRYPADLPGKRHDAKHYPSDLRDNARIVRN
jgi:hypothetical protein